MIYDSRRAVVGGAGAGGAGMAMGGMGAARGATVAGCGGSCDGGGEANMITYTGAGGSYVQETTYKYVGYGAGNYEVTPVRGGCNWVCIGCGSVCGLLTLLALLLFLFWPQPDNPVVSTTPEFDCNAGFARWEIGWSIAKKAWCCEQVGRGCPTRPTEAPAVTTQTRPPPPPPPTDAPVVTTVAPTSAPVVTTVPNLCNVGAVHEWTAEKKAYCCAHFNNGCDTAEPAPAPAPDYDCNAGWANWQAGWSVAKKAWCCTHTGKACPQTTGGCASLPYDCNAGFANWQAGWSEPKKEWCCKHAGKGCPPPASLPYDCDAGYANWAAGWSVGKKAWCCQHTGRGCPPAAGGCA